MKPRLPDSPHQNGRLVVFGEIHSKLCMVPPPYDPLPASVDPEGLVMTEWEFSAEDLALILEGGKLRLWIWTGRKPPQPVLLQPVLLEVVE